MKPITRVCRCGLLLMFVAVAAPAVEPGQGVLTVDHLRSWLEAYGEAWEARDADKAAGLFGEDSSYQDSPYEEPH
ncbi:MAG: hypothetical protein ACREUU_12710, partial [Gammaproteobacteria bacterium]